MSHGFRRRYECWPDPKVWVWIGRPLELKTCLTPPVIPDPRKGLSTRFRPRRCVTPPITPRRPSNALS